MTRRHNNAVGHSGGSAERASAAEAAPGGRRHAWAGGLLLAMGAGAALGSLAALAGASLYTAGALAFAAGVAISAGGLSAARRLFRRATRMSDRAANDR